MTLKMSKSGLWEENQIMDVSIDDGIASDITVFFLKGR
jgi:hypothetical protein